MHTISKEIVTNMQFHVTQTSKAIVASSCFHWIPNGNQFTVKYLTIMASISVHDKNRWMGFFFVMHTSFIDKHPFMSSIDGVVWQKSCNRKKTGCTRKHNDQSIVPTNFLLIFASKNQSKWKITNCQCRKHKH